MTLYKYIREIWKQPKKNLGAIWNERLMQWRREPVTVRIERPTRLDRARSLGYKPKPGVIVVRQRVIRGGHERPAIRKGRRSKHKRQRMVLAKSYQRIAEERANTSFKNCEVLNSYFVAKDGRHYWYEVILVDRSHPCVLADKQLAGITGQRGRAIRGLTSAGRRSRGMLTNRGIGAEKLRPSLKAHGR